MTQHAVPHPPFDCTAVLFDLDDTLYQRREVFHKWATTFASERFPGLDGTQRDAIIDYLVELDDNGYTSRFDFFTTLRQKYPIIADSVEDLIKNYMAHYIPLLALDPAALLLLQALHDAHVPFGIVTNGKTDLQTRKIQALGLDRLTSCLFISEQFGASKPDASIFEAAAACLHTEPQSIVFVGDNPRNDIWGAHQLGMRTIWMDVPASQWSADIPEDTADARVTVFSQLLPLFGLKKENAENREG